MTKEIRNPNVEGRSGMRSPDSSFGFRYSFGFRHSSFGFEVLRFMESARWGVSWPADWAADSDGAAANATGGFGRNSSAASGPCAFSMFGFNRSITLRVDRNRLSGDNSSVCTAVRRWHTH